MKLYIIVRQVGSGQQLVLRGAGEAVAAFRDEDTAWKIIVDMARERGAYSGARVVPVEVVEPLTDDISPWAI